MDPVRVLRIRNRLAAIGCGFAVVAWASCSGSPQKRYEQRLADTDKPALHAVHGQRLEELMNRMNRMMYDPIIDASHTSTLDRAKATKEMARVAGQLAEASSHIAESLPLGQLNETEEQLFDNLAAKLRDEALELQRHAEAKRHNQLEVSLNELTATCNACHSAFRLAPDPVR